MEFSPNLDQRLRCAIQAFWNYAVSLNLASRVRRVEFGMLVLGAQLLGGAQMNGFLTVIRDLLEESGIGKPVIFTERSVELPGWFRPEKKWDLLVVVEFGMLNCRHRKVRESHGWKMRTSVALKYKNVKSQVGSCWNNYNNRTEEALGSATDIWAAYREGAFKPSSRPWLGYLMLLEEAPDSIRPVRAQEPHFRVFEEFKSASYAKRYEILLTKLVRERLYDSACFLMSRPR